jgi:hypothetical protein
MITATVSNRSGVSLEATIIQMHSTIATPKPSSRKRTYTYSYRFLLINCAARLARISDRKALRLSSNPANETLYDRVVNAELSCHVFADADVPRLTIVVYRALTRLLVAPDSYAVPAPDDFAESRAGAAVFSGAC